MVHYSWNAQKAICRLILEGNADQAFADYRVSTLDQAIFRRMADDVVMQIVRRRSVPKRYFRATIKNPIWLSLSLSAVIGLSATVGALYLLHFVGLADPETYPMLGASAGFFAIGVAAVGWGVSGWIAHRNNRSKYTLDVVAARYAQTAFTDALRSFNDVFKGKMIDEATVSIHALSTDENDRAAAQGVRYLVNYFEFIAVGVLEGELDERIVAKTLRGNLIYIYDRCAPYIIDLQRRNPRTLENFTMLRRHYRDL